MARTPDTDPDAGMRAVARVRGVREQDSRLGLAQASADLHEAVRRLDSFAARLVETHDPEVADPASFAAARAVAAGAALDVSTSRAALASSTMLHLAAREHWQRDRTRVAAVELLLERRAERRRAERLRRERVEVDDLVAARWLRAESTPGAAGATR
ncbi:hypothetical protein GCM10009641_33770 [Mycobacterium cookii]|uniref:Flagellar FliJ protein n=1 Tax=Nocardioides furvisabuli TaxID=375542 RepID=A0ABN2WXW3_9ACTN|nr:hypothetical protein [Nocardioides furvisabuli]